MQAVRQGANRPDLEALVADLAPSVRSGTTLRGYAAVPVTLGLVERSGGRDLALTSSGKRFARSGDLRILREALVSRVLGVRELLEEVAKGPTTCPQLTERLADRGIWWNHPMAVRYRVWWLVSAGAIDTKRDSRVDRLTLSRAGRQLLARSRASAN